MSELETVETSDTQTSEPTVPVEHEALSVEADLSSSTAVSEASTEAVSTVHVDDDVVKSQSPQEPTHASAFPEADAAAAEDLGVPAPERSESGEEPTVVEAGQPGRSKEVAAAEDAGGAPPVDRWVPCLLSVRGAVSWAERQPGGAPHQRFIGAAALRLLQPLAETLGDDAGELLERLESLDTAPERARRRALGRIRSLADRLLGEHAPKPRRRGRRNRKDGTKRRPKAELAAPDAVSGPGEVEAPSPGNAEPATPEVLEGKRAAPAPEPSTGRGNRKRRRGRRRGGATAEPKAQPSEASESTPSRAVDTPRAFPLGHPSGTGRSLSELGFFQEPELATLAEAGIHTVVDILRLSPGRHHRGSQVGIAGVVQHEPVVVRGPIRWRVVRLTAHGCRWEVALGDEKTPPLRVRWFRAAPRGWERWEAGQEVGLYGEVREAEDGPTMYEAEPLGLYGQGSPLLPEYSIEGVDERRMRDGIALALEQTEGRLKDWLPKSIRDQHRLLTLDEAFRDAHFPANATRRGRLRLAFDELFTIQVGVAWKSGRGKPGRGIAHKPVHTGIGQIESQHQIVLDDSQEVVFSEIRRDLVRSAPMNRLLQGDVGSGKGLVAQLSAMMVVGGGCQAAMVYPDSLAAERRFLHIDPILRSIGIKTLLIPDDRVDRAQLDAIRRGEAQVVFGTQALLQKSVTWKRLGIVVAEERGPYGMLDVEALGRRGTRPDLLVIPRAPIPSSLAFTVFADFDVSTLHSGSPRPVQCETFASSARDDAYTSLREVVASGRQGYVVFPVRDGRDLLSVEDAVRTAQALRKDLLPEARMGVYSSEMSREERSRVFDDFQQRRIDVLVCTTFIEDSPEVTNATAMVVEYADLHDLVRLHRLRAHVSNGYRNGNCAFVTSDNPAPEQLERLQQLQVERDGFRLAELDLQYRGASAVLGDRASQAPTFSWAVPPEDRGLFLRARSAAFDLVRRDPELRHAGGVAQTVNARWGDWLGQALPNSAPKKRGDGRRRRRKRR